MPAFCPVAALLPAFKLTIELIETLDEQCAGQPHDDAPEYLQRADAAAWDSLRRLQNMALDLPASSPAGLALQLTLMIDDLVKLETCNVEEPERHQMFKRARSALRAILPALDIRPVKDAGVAAMFVGHRYAEALLSSS